MAILKDQGWPAEMIEAIAGHAPYLGVPRITPLARTLFAVDELCGLITAVAYVRPSRKVADVEVSSVTKKMKDKAFARSVSREDIVLGTEELGIPLPQHVQNCLTAMREAAESLGL
jgi:predicted hydrolase (HD superfamily)